MKKQVFKWYLTPSKCKKKSFVEFLEVHFGPYHGKNTDIGFQRKHICKVPLAAIRQPYMIRMAILSNKHKKTSLKMIFNTIKKQKKCFVEFLECHVGPYCGKVPI